MQNSVYCRTTDKGIQTFYLNHEGKDYYLFQQEFRVSVRDYFKNGISIEKIFTCKGKGGHAVVRTISKLPAHIRFIEKEYDIVVLDKTKRKNNPLSIRNKNAYRRERFSLTQAYGLTA